MSKFKIKLNKKYIILTSSILAIGAIIGAVIWWYSFAILEDNAFLAIPKNSAFIVEIPQPTQLFVKLEDKAYQSDIQQLNFIKKASQQWESLSQKLPNDVTSQIQRLTIAAQIGAENDLDFIHILSTKNDGLPLEQCLINIQMTFNKRRFSQHDYFIIADTDSTEMVVASAKNLVIVARTPSMIESALDQMDNFISSINRESSLKKIQSLIGKNADLTVFVNMKQVPLFASFFTKDKAQKNIDFLKFFADWIGLDFTFQEKSINIDGYMSPKRQNELLKSLTSQELPDKTLIASVLPDNTASMIYVGFKSTEAFFDKIAVAENEIFKEFFLPWMSDEIAYLITEPKLMASYEEHQFAIFKTKDIALASQRLEALGQKFGTLASEEYFNYTITQILAKDIIKPIFGNGLNTIQNPFYVIVDDYVVFCNSLNALQELLDKYTYGQTLGQDINYLQFAENLSVTANMYCYINTSNMLDIMKALMSDKQDSIIQNEFEFYQKLTPIGLQFTPYQDLFVINGQIQYNAKGKQATSVLWKTDLESTVIIPPTFVKNHKTQELEIFVQDVNNNIYLLNRNGELLWSRKIDGRIVSEIHQIDYYKNNFLQYIFNTDSEIYIIDRNGDYVENFPILITEGISNSILVVDYDKTRDYRYFVATDAGNIYGFQKDGKFLEGWSPKTDIGTIRFPLQHFDKEGKDYLVALNGNGEMYFFQRNGEVRMDSIQFKQEFISTFGYDLSEPPRIVVANQRGKAFVLNFNRKFFRLGMNVDENKNMQFLYSDILGNTRKDYIVMGKNELGIFSYTEDNDFDGFGKYQFNHEQSQLFQVEMPQSDKYKIGTLSETDKLAYLFNGQAKLFPDFPLPGTTSFEIENLFDDEVKVLVIGYDNAVFAYKLKSVVF